MTAESIMEIPSWQREIENFAGVKPIFVLEGNVHDLYPFKAGASWQFVTLETLLQGLLRGEGDERPYRMLFCDPLRGMTNPIHDSSMRDLVVAADAATSQLKDDAKELNFAGAEQPFSENRNVYDSALIRAALSCRLAIHGHEASDDAASSPVACVYDFASRLAASPGILTPEENAIFLNLQIGGMQAIRPDGKALNTLVLVTNQASELPPWFYLDNPRVRQIAIPTPDRSIRELYVKTAFADMQDGNVAEDPSLSKVRDRLIDLTDSMRLVELDEIRRLHIKGQEPPQDVLKVVDAYKYGIKENRWAAIIGKLKDDPEGTLKKRVKGQGRAIDSIVSVLKRSALGFSGMQHSSSSKPKGVMFLAGPTGTGKTEAVKAVTELLFGDERSYLRFDMSEYAAENADQKLFGAPPGYVGYESGGQLTNAVRQNPFSVLLFDEIEKAHPSIMDKFLQILEDGRMTDGQGNTVYFSESLIFFTSNVGISQEVLDEHGRVVGRESIVKPGEPYDEMVAKVKGAMQRHFKPEVMNRIGDNIIVFDYISPDASALIVDSQVNRICSNIKAEKGIQVDVEGSALDWLKSNSLADEVRQNGGRGIGNLVESEFLTPLATFVFNNDIESGMAVVAKAAPRSEHLDFQVR